MQAYVGDDKLPTESGQLVCAVLRHPFFSLLQMHGEGLCNVTITV